MKPLRFYVLDGHEVKAAADVLEWGKFFQNGYRHVAKTDVGDYWVSTVFIGLDQNFYDEDGPVEVFETMVFKGGESDQWHERSSTWEEAEATHERAVGWAKSQLV